MSLIVCAWCKRVRNSECQLEITGECYIKEERDSKEVIREIMEDPCPDDCPKLGVCTMDCERLMSMLEYLRILAKREREKQAAVNDDTEKIPRPTSSVK